VLACQVADCQVADSARPPATPSVTPLKHPTLRVCNKRADAHHLTGPARAQFVKDCTDGKT